MLVLLKMIKNLRKITHHSSRLVTQDVLLQCFFDLYMHAYCEGQL
jgi:hypothetical protein